MATIAGHTFVSQSNGTEKCDCGKYWTDVAGATKADVGKGGWAHSGTLNEAELGQIEAERDRRWDVGMGVTRKKVEAASG